MNNQKILKILKDKHGYDLERLNIFPGTRTDVTDEEYADEVARSLKAIEDGDYEILDDNEDWTND